MTALRAFHGDPAIKAKYLARVRAHRAADEIIQGKGWDGMRGCAVGCTLDAYDHDRYPIELGLPVWLARLEDAIHERLPNADALAWPEQFLEAIPVGADTEPVLHRAGMSRMDRLIALQRDALGQHGKTLDDVLHQVIDALILVRACHEADVLGQPCDWQSAYSAARSAYSAAYSAARSAWAADSAYSAAWRQERDELLALLRSTA